MRSPHVAAALLLVAATAAVDGAPNYQGCISANATALPFCDSSLSHEARVEDLLGRLTLAEKVQLVSPSLSGNSCDMQQDPIERLGLPGYMWLDETNTAAASVCPAQDRCATTFPGPEGLGASFNRTLWWAKGDALSAEFRALNNIGGYRGQGPSTLLGFTGFGPNINIARDPRFGRNSELPGEDPLLTGTYAAQYLHGLQQEDDNGFVRMISYLKHFTAYSEETNRGHDTHNISSFDWWDTYLPQYEQAFKEGGANGVMCSYNAENGNPSCANGWLLNTVMRGMWGAPDAVVMTDCGAVPNMRGPPAFAPDDSHAVAWTINNGTDLEAGSTLWTKNLQAAVQSGLVSEDRVTESVRRTILQHMRAGRFDAGVWQSLGIEQLNSTAHQQLNFEAAAQSFVLLKNDGGLPLKKGANVAVLGPMSNTRAGLLSDYAGDQQCYNDKQDADAYYCIPTVGEAMAAANTGGTTTQAQGVNINDNNSSDIANALNLAKAADVVVLAMGIDHSIEHEGIDRVNISLPGLQVPFVQQVLAVGKPTVLVIMNGGALAIDGLIDGPKAIVEAFNPSVRGAPAIAATLFGDENRFGKLPITVYPADIVNKLNLSNFDMSLPPGRTYRYHTDPVLFPFGFGLSYTTFTHACKQSSAGGGDDDAAANSNGDTPGAAAAAERIAGPEAIFGFECTVTNTGSAAGDEVLQVYHVAGDGIRKAANHPVPLRQLVDFDRVSLAPGATSAPLSFSLGRRALSLTAANGTRVVYAGEHTFVFSRGNGADVNITVTV